MKPQFILLALIAGALYWMYQLFEPYLLNIVLASLLAISTDSFKHALHRLVFSETLATILSTIFLALLLFAPLGYLLGMIMLNLQELDPEMVSQVLMGLRSAIEGAPEFLNDIKPDLLEILDRFNIATLTAKAVQVTAEVGELSLMFVKDALMITVFYFFAHLYGKRLVDYFKEVLMLGKEDDRLLSGEISSVMSIVFYSILLTATLEGALFGVYINAFGYDGLLLGIIFGVASLIPIVGGSIVWIPLAIYELSQGNSINAAMLTVYSIVVIAIIADTFIKPMIIKTIDLRLSKTETRRNELIIFFSILAGLTSFGFWGMILGPAITAFFMALIMLQLRRNAQVDPWAS